MKLSKIPYKRVTLEEATKNLNKFIENFKKAKNAKQQISIYNKCNEYSSKIGTMFSLANIRYTQDTTDEFYIKEKDYLNENGPYITQLIQQFADMVLESKFINELKNLMPEIIFTKLEYFKKTFNDKILKDMQVESKLSMEYSQYTATALIEFNGEKLTLSQMGKYRQSADRKIRLAAYTAQGKWLKESKEKLDTIFDQLVKVRTSMAKKLGFKNYVELAHYKMGRIGYTREDLHVFREQVKRDLVPLIAELKKKQANDLCIDKITLIDDSTVFKNGNPAPIGTPEEIFANGKKMYHALSPDTGKFIDFMLKHELFDVLARENKANGGYCSSLESYKMPFIFANFNGTSGDIDVLTHEAGHALATYKAFSIPWHDLRNYSMETAEVHSMSMEFFAEKWMDLFFGDRSDDYKYMHLLNSLSFIPYGTVVDNFQEIIYTQPNMSPDERHATFVRLMDEFCPQLSCKDIDGYDYGARWQLQLHIFEYPFYYIDYCLAQTVALEFYTIMSKDFDEAWQKYIKFLSSAGKKSFPDVVAFSGMSSPFERGVLKRIATQVQQELKKK